MLEIAVLRVRNDTVLRCVCALSTRKISWTDARENVISACSRSKNSRGWISPEFGEISVCIHSPAKRCWSAPCSPCVARFQRAMRIAVCTGGCVCVCAAPPTGAGGAFPCDRGSVVVDEPDVLSAVSDGCAAVSRALLGSAAVGRAPKVSCGGILRGGT